MSDVRLVCDSTADLSASLVAAHGVEVVPLKVIFGDEQLAGVGTAVFANGGCFKPEELCAALGEAKVTAPG